MLKGEFNNFYRLFIDLIYFLEEFYKKKSTFDNTQIMVKKYLKLLNETPKPPAFSNDCGDKLINTLNSNSTDLITPFEEYRLEIMLFESIYLSDKSFLEIALDNARLLPNLPIKWKLYKFWIKYRN